MKKQVIFGVMMLLSLMANAQESLDGSYWRNSDQWKIVFSDDYYISFDDNLGYYSNDFWIKSLERINKNDFDNIVNSDKKLETYGAHFRLIPHDIEAFRKLTNQEKLKVLKKNLARINHENEVVEVSTQPYDVGFSQSVNDQSVIGYYFKGKYTSKEAEDAAEQKRNTANIASFTKRFGFNPQGKPLKQLIKVGRSFKLLKDWNYGYLQNQDKAFVKFNLSIDHGSSKNYDMIWYDHLLTNKLGHIWVSGDKITSVVWYK